MKYHLEEWFDDNPKEINHLIFSWEEAVLQFGYDLAQFNWGESGENCYPYNISEDIEGYNFDDSGDKKMGMNQKFYITDKT